MPFKVVRNTQHSATSCRASSADEHWVASGLGTDDSRWKMEKLDSME